MKLGVGFGIILYVIVHNLPQTTISKLFKFHLVC